MKQYLEMLDHILTKGNVRKDRTGVGTIGVFGYQTRYNLQDGFPLVTTKKMFWKAIVGELIWMLSGSTNIKPLVENGISIWTDWPLHYYNQSHVGGAMPDIAQCGFATKEEFEHAIINEPGFAKKYGDLGPVYGAQWRKWKGHTEPRSISIEDIPQNTAHQWYAMGSTKALFTPEIDQLSNLLHDLKANPFSRRHIISAWNVPDIPFMMLPPCHLLFQFNVREIGFEARRRLTDNYELITFPWPIGKPENHEYLDGVGRGKIPRYYLDCMLTQRSMDSFLGGPFNIAQYALMTHMIAAQVNMLPGEFVHSIGDAHIYLNHVDQVKEQLERWPLPLPTLKLAKRDSLFEHKIEDVQFENYSFHPAIKAPIAV